MNTTFVTHNYPTDQYSAEMFQLSSAHNARVAASYGWSVVADSKRRVPDRSYYREKAALLVETIDSLKDGDRILWVDGDALLIGKHIDHIFNDLGNYDLGMVKVRLGRWNSGVMPIAVNPITRDLWVQVRDHSHRGPWIDGPLTTQISDVRDIDGQLEAAELREQWSGHKCASCPYAPNERGPLCGSFTTSVIELDKKWNSETVEKDTEIVHIAFFDHITKLRRVKEILRG